MIVSSDQKIQECLREGWWGEETLFDLFQANVSATPDALAVADPPNRAQFTDGAVKRLSYCELHDYVARIVDLFSDRDIAKDDIVVIQLPNVVELVAVLLATARLGIIASPLPMQYGKREISHVLAKLHPKAVVTVGHYKGASTGERMADISREVGGVDYVFMIDEDGMSELISREQASLPTVGRQSQIRNSVCANDVFSICWTSGTEAEPKAVPRSHNHWICLSRGIVENVGIEKGEILLNPFPLVNAAGIGSLFVPWLLTGGALIQHHPFDAAVFVEQVEAERVNYTCAAPAVVTQLLKDPGLKGRERFGSVRRLGCGAAPLSPWMVLAFEAEYGIPVVNILGSNEGAFLISHPRDILSPEARAQIFPRFGVEGLEWASISSHWMKTKLVDTETGEEITEPGIPGEFLIKGPMVFEGYYTGGALNRAAFDEQGFFHTGDQLEIAEIDGKPIGYRFVGRLKEIIIRGGMNISPEEIEELIVGHPKVKEVAMVGYPDDVLGERACAVVVPLSGETVSLEEVVSYLRGKGIATYKLPERLKVVEELPRNALGKVVRRNISPLLQETS